MLTIAVISILLLRVSFARWKSVSHKTHTPVEVVVVLQFSAIQSPFSKYLDLKDFLEISLSVASPHSARRCTQPFSVFVRLFAYVGEQVGGKYLQKKPHKCCDL